MKLPRRLVIAGLAIGTVAVAVPGASADNNRAIPRGIAAGANFTGVIANGLVVVFECHAAGIGDAVSVAIKTCKVSTGTRNYPLAAPGAFVASAGTDTVPFAPFQVCWSAVATFSNASTASTSGCTQLPSIGGVPSLAGGGLSQNFQ